MSDVLSIPRYKVIKSELLKEIEDGRFRPGQKFYSESELKKRFGASTTTIVRSIQELVNDGHLVRFQGKGTYISKAKKNKTVMFTESDNLLSGTLSVKLITCAMENNPEIRQKLKITESEPYYRIVRVKLCNEKPYALQVSYIPSRYFSHKLSGSNITLVSIYDHLMKENGFDMYAMPFVESIEATALLEESATKLLNIKRGSPVITIKRWTHDNAGNVIEYIETCKTLDTFRIDLRTPDKGSG